MNTRKMIADLLMALALELPEDLKMAKPSAQWTYLMGYVASQRLTLEEWKKERANFAEFLDMLKCQARGE